MSNRFTELVHFPRIEPDISSTVVKHLLDRHGCVLLANFEPSQLRSLFSETAVPTRHRDAAADDFTHITPNHPSAGKPGYDGFTTKGLPPHTDGSGLERPPEVLATICTISAPVGGSATLTHGRRIVADLGTAGVLDEVAATTCYFGPLRVAAPIVDVDEQNHSYTIRYRDDRLVDFGALSPATVATIRAVIADNTVTVDLDTGDGYLALNSRVLHGRTAFAGNREVLRLIGHSVAESERAAA